jgi:hypothetical protein
VQADLLAIKLGKPLHQICRQTATIDLTINTRLFGRRLRGVEFCMSSAVGSSTPLIAGDCNSFQSRYETADFAFRHQLATHSVFELESLQRLLARHNVQGSNCYWSSGAVLVQDSWSAGTRERRSLRETLEAITTNDSLIILKNVESDSVLGPFVHQIMRELIDRVGEQLEHDIVRRRATLLIASPRRTTSYHMDGDTNFLFQITGSKLFHVLSKHDRRAVPDIELEEYFAGNPNAAVYKPARLPTARQYQLVPGAGIHIPSAAPHWAHTLDNVSIALSINFDLRSVEQRARIYRLNAQLRRWGLHPTPPGHSAILDGLKLAAHGLLRTARRAATSGAAMVPPPVSTH